MASNGGPPGSNGSLVVPPFVVIVVPPFVVIVAGAAGAASDALGLFCIARIKFFAKIFLAKASIFLEHLD